MKRPSDAPPPAPETAADRVRAFYADYHARFGHTSGWPSAEDARRVYAAACDAPEVDWSRVDSVLDVGSGEGRLLGYLRRACGFTGAYLGVELLEDAHRRAARRFRNDPDATFVRADFDAMDLGGARFDWVFSLGSLAVRQPDQAERDRATLRRMIAAARVGVVLYVNDASRMPPWQRDDMPELAVHDLAAVCTLLITLGCPARNLRWYDADHSVVIHALRNPE